MPKMKTHSGAKKRFRITGTRQGHAPQGRQDAPERAQAEHAVPAGSTGDAVLAPGDAAKAKKLLGKRAERSDRRPLADPSSVTEHSKE